MKSRKRKLLGFVLSSVLAAGLFCSCNHDNLLENNEEHTFVQEFLLQYGNIDPDQDWNMAEQKTLHVESGTSISSLKVYAKSNGEYHIVADYHNVSGPRDIRFDVPRGYTAIKVKADGNTFSAKAGDNITAEGASSPAASRWSDGDEDVTGDAFSDIKDEVSCWFSDISWSGTYKVFSTDVIRAILSNGPYEVLHNGRTYTGADGFLPKGVDVPANRFGRDVFLDFLFETNGDPITLYTMYWDTPDDHYLGLYYLDETQEPPVKRKISLLHDSSQENALTGGSYMMYMSCMWNPAQWNDWTFYPIWIQTVCGVNNAADIFAKDSNNNYILEYTDGDDHRWLYFDSSRNKYISYEDPINLTGVIEYNIDQNVNINDSDLRDKVKCTVDPTYMAMINNYVTEHYSNTIDTSVEPYVDILHLPSEQPYVDFVDRTPNNISGHILYPWWRVAKKLNGESGLEPFNIWDVYSDEELNSNYKHLHRTPKSIATQGITIQIKEEYVGKKIGFYLKASDGGTAYSQSARNSNGQSYAATFIHPVTKELFFTWEDAFSNDGMDDLDRQKDFNDLMFVLEGGISRVVGTNDDVLIEIIDEPGPGPGPESPINEDTPFIYIVAAEDMGSIGDNDYNDVVFGISYVAGQNKVKVYPLAAGGTLPARVMIGDTQVGGEWHSIFGETSDKMINTNRLTITFPEPIEVYVGSEWSLSTTASQVMGSISIVIQQDEEERVITGSQPGEVPAIIIVDGYWRWPLEMVNIADAYPGFSGENGWVGNSSAITWKNNRSDNSTYTWSADDLPQ